MKLQIRIAGVIEESYVDGEGIRFAVFVQGCPHHCEGCHNPQTFDFQGGQLVEIEELLDRICSNPLLSGLTLTGGEPLCQIVAATELARLVKQIGLNVWCYTGFTYEEIVGLTGGAENFFDLRLAKRFLETIDVLVDGPFMESRRDLDLQFCGSTNQRVIDVSRTLLTNRVTTFQS